MDRRRESGGRISEGRRGAGTPGVEGRPQPPAEGRGPTPDDRANSPGSPALRPCRAPLRQTPLVMAATAGWRWRLMARTAGVASGAASRDRRNERRRPLSAIAA